MEICPRCGQKGTPASDRRGARRYIYFFHVRGGQRRKCYIGPLEGYVHVEKLHGLELKNIKDVDYTVVMERALERAVEAYLKKVKAEGEDPEKVKREVLERLKKRIEEIISSL